MKKRLTALLLSLALSAAMTAGPVMAGEIEAASLVPASVTAAADESAEASADIDETAGQSAAALAAGGLTSATAAGDSENMTAGDSEGGSAGVSADMTSSDASDTEDSAAEAGTDRSVRTASGESADDDTETEDVRSEAGTRSGQAAGGTGTGTVDETELEEISRIGAQAADDNSETTDSGLYENTQAADFVERLYTIVLGRASDPVGKQSWYDKLTGGSITGSTAAYGFIFSSEFTKKKLSDSDYVTVLYRTLLNREPDSSGLKNWTGQLSKGATRRSVFIGFANSAEFQKLCAGYGITAGKATSDDACDTHTKVVFYVRRLYESFLGRSADSTGLHSWVTKIATGEQSPEKVAYGFVFSQEFLKKKYSNTEFLQHLYQGLFGRAADSSGLANWLSLLENGYTRIYVLKGFLGSQEYLNMVASYGINAGRDPLNEYGGYDYTGSIRAEAYLAIDANSGETILSQNADQVMQLASMTKLMVALLVTEHVSDFSKQIQCTSDAYADITYDTTTAGLVVGQYYSIETLMEGMLVYSGADCANMLACYVGGTKAHFVDMMNARAKALGMTSTNFQDPVGLYDGNYSTANQFMKLLRVVLENDTIIRMTSMSSCVVADVNGNYAHSLNSSNGLLNGLVAHDTSLYTVNGLKTGTTGSAGYCLATSSYNSAGNRILTVVLNSTSYYNRANDSKLLLDTIYKNAAKGYYCLR